MSRRTGAIGTAMGITYSPRNQRTVSKAAKAERRRMYVLWAKKLETHDCTSIVTEWDLLAAVRRELRDGIWQQFPHRFCCDPMIVACDAAIHFRSTDPSLTRAITEARHRAILQSWADKQADAPKGTLSR